MKALKSRVMAVMVMAILVSGCSFDGVYDLPLPGNKVSKDDGFLVSADFADVLNVVPRSSVMVADVPVGQVESVVRVGWHARVTMRISKDVELPDNAEAEIRQTSLLGEKFVALAPPTSDSGEESEGSGRLGPGDVIPMDSTGRNPEVEEVLGALSVLLSGGGIGQLQTITFELNEMMEGRTGKIKNVLDRLNVLVRTLDTQRGDIVQAMDSINGLSKTLIAEKKTIGDALDAAAPAIKVLRGQHSELVEMLSALDKLGVVGTRVINEIKDDLVAELRHLEPILRNVANAGRDQSAAPNCQGCDTLVPGLVAAAGYPFPVDAGDTIHGDFANVVFKMQIKLTPVSEGGLLPTTLQDLETLCRSTPLAPICSPVGDAVGQLCGLLGALPICAETGNAALAPDGAQPGSASPTTPTLPDFLKPPTAPDAGGGGSGGTFVDRFFGGLLGGGSG
jgi:phospholipid/cholesterol/gamma-HCH transport system substrate-binding protein